MKVVIFDWGGTIIDFGCQSPLISFEKAFKDAGYPVTRQHIIKYMGNSKREHVRKLLKDLGKLTDSLEEKIYANFKEILMQEIPKHLDLTPGYTTLMDYLHLKGYKIGSTTGYTREMTNRIVECGSHMYLPTISVTSDEVGHGRPSPDMVYENLLLLGIDHPRYLIKIGDTIADIEEGVAAGAHLVIGVVDSSSLMGLTVDEYQNMSEKELEERRIVIREKFMNVRKKVSNRTNCGLICKNRRNSSIDTTVQTEIICVNTLYNVPDIIEKFDCTRD